MILRQVGSRWQRHIETTGIEVIGDGADGGGSGKSMRGQPS